MRDLVYHYTCLHSLPAIVASGVLLPSKFDTELASGEPLLWATVDPNVDRTARPFVDEERLEAIRAGTSKLVRITLPARGFISWKTLRRRRLRQAEADGFDDIVLDGIQFAFEDYELSAACFGQHGVENTWRVRVPHRQPLALDPEIRSPIRKTDMTGFVYHYTDSECLSSIVASGVLLPTEYDRDLEADSDVDPEDETDDVKRGSIPDDVGDTDRAEVPEEGDD